MPPIIDVAARTGISPTVLSQTLNGTRGVEPATRGRVWDAACEPGSRPNALARGLPRRETLTIGLIVPDNADPFIADRARAVEDVGVATGPSVVGCNLNRSTEAGASTAPREAAGDAGGAGELP